MEEPKGKRKLANKLKDRYRLVILNENTLEDVWYAVLSRMNVMVWIGLIGVVLVALGIVLVSFTPLREYIPGYPDGNIRWLYLQNAIKMDSLEKEIKIRDQYIENIRLILRGKETESYVNISDTVSELTDISFDQTNFDSVLSVQIEEEERYNVSSRIFQPEQEKFDLNKLHFYCPLKGTITNLYDAQGNHYGIDIVSNLNEPILSVLDGTVIMAGWTLEAGYVIQVQHDNNIISIYKHNSQLLQQMGDRVMAGEALAIIGNTGEFTTGPHLHFELWHSGKPLNPRDYIVF
ncbi:MAG: M23 family metallopeptidase [Salinivirgaceae bacterium]|jgi:murein DD-endopeptidase MepM/ murein hydrolase activator NlpD|nr:M23 family metallopeptidase [Salinivirgaceae bacterium]